MRTWLGQHRDAHAAEAEAAAWAAVYADALPRVYNFFRFRTGDDALAEDLTAAVFEKAWRHRHRYRHDLASFTTWLFAIARNTAVSHHRSARWEVRLDAANMHAIAPSIECEVERRDDLTRLVTLLARLPPRERELVELKYGAALTNRAVARVTGLSESNVGTILARVVHRLAAQWEENEP